MPVKIANIDTFVEAIQANSLDFEVPIESHLPVDILAQSGLPCCGATRNPDEDPIGSYLITT